MSGFTYQNALASADYCEMYPQVQKTIVCSLGGYAMKRGWRSDKLATGTGYSYEGDKELLPMPNATDCSPENSARYHNYKHRASIIEFTSRTKKAMLGLAGFKPHNIELPSSIEYLIKNADNAGTTLNEQIKLVTADLMDQGTGGLLVDIPSGQSVSQADIDNGIRANIKVYDFLNILKSAYKVINFQKKLAYVLLRESVTTIDPVTNDEECSYQYRRLTLEQQESGEYIYKHELLDDDGRTPIEETVYPTGFDGQPLKEILFFPIGTLNNSLDNLDPPLLLPIAELNIGQYRNSADVEENAYQASQSTINIFTAGVSEDFVYKCGANAVNTFGNEDKVEMLQAEESNLSDKLQLQKVRDAISIGASIIDGNGPEQKVEVVKIEQSANNASLDGLIHNIQMAYRHAINACELLMSGANTEYTFDLNVEFFPFTMTPEKITAWVQMVQLNMAPMEYFTKMMVKAGEFPEDATEQDIRDMISAQNPQGVV